MFRLQQLTKKVIKDFLKKEGRLPSELETQNLLDTLEVYGPSTAPMVPEKEAKSNAIFIRDTLKALVHDRDDISKLTEELTEKVRRIQSSTIDESKDIIARASNILTKYKDNDFKTIHNEVPILPDSADVYKYYLYGPDPYAEILPPGEELGYSSQYIALDSYNVKAGKEGISLMRGAEEIINASLKIKPYSSGNPVFLQTINEINPISITVRGTNEQKKGIDIYFELTTSTNVAQIELDADPAQVEVWVDSKKLLSKSIDGKTALIIGKEVKESLILRLYGTEAIVPILIRNIKLTKVDEGAGYSSGKYVTLDMQLPSQYGNIIFKPDEYLPKGTHIDWAYSAERLYWTAIEKDEEGNYLPIDWNSNEHSSPTLNAISLTDSLTSLYTIPENNAQGLKIKMGKDAILFSTSKLLGYYAFTTYVTPTVESGYTLSFYNPKIDESNFLIQKINITSETVQISKDAEESVAVDIPEGTHKVELILNQNEEFNLDNYNYSEKGILKTLLDNFNLQFDLNFASDIFGRTVDIAIQPYGLSQVPAIKFNHISPAERLDSFSWTASNKVIVETLKPGDLYDIIPLKENYYTTQDVLIPNELHYYEGAGIEGTDDWTFSLYHEPTTDVTMHTPEVTVTPTGSEITIPKAHLNSTSTDKIQFLQYSGTPPITEFTLEETPIGASIDLITDNLDDDCKILEEGAETQVITFGQEEPEVIEELTYLPITSTITLVQDDTDNEDYTFSYNESTNSVTVERTDMVLSAQISITYEYEAPQNNNFEHRIGEELVVTPGGGIALTRSVSSGQVTVTNGAQSDDFSASFNGSAYVINDLSSIEAEAGDIVFAQYNTEVQASVENNILTLSNLPVNSTTKKWYTDATTINAPSADTELILNHPVYSNTATNEVTITINGSAFGGTLTILGNIITLDLSSEITDPQEPLSLYVTYPSYEHEVPYKIRVEYSYYAKEPYTFNYHFDENIAASVADIYSNSSMYNNFYDISYYTSEGSCYIPTGDVMDFDPNYTTQETCEDAGGSWHVSLFLKADLTTDGKDTPIIRRIRFDRQ